ncbi:MAG: hypothetical protein KDC00_05265 [Flavobacteriales bacterium]|nr:hypothetical protein [Flavobacteriales bacterium]
MNSTIPASPNHTAVMITAFKRYDTARLVMEAVRSARPPRLYFACDGPRNEAEKERTDRVRTLVELVDWPCEVHTLFHEKNKGTKYGMVENMDWFFSQEAEGIVLEDDIVPDQSFFRFAQELLERYRDDERIWAIIGNNLATGGEVKDPRGYWFMAHGYGAYSGWAGWRRSWERFDVDMKDWPEVRDSKRFDPWFLSSGERKEALHLLEATWDGRIAGAWDYQFDYAKMKAGAVNIIPNVNLCRNVGFGEDATHSVDRRDPRNQEHLHSAEWPLEHPVEITVDTERNLAYFNAYVRPPLFRRFKSTLKGLLPDAVDEAITPFLSKLQRRLGLT